MSEPTTLEFAVIKLGDGLDPETFVSICGINTTGFNRAVQTNDRYIKDCTSPAATPNRRVKVTGRLWTLTGTGYFNVDQAELIEDAIGVRRNYQYLLLDDDGVTVLTTASGIGVLTAANMGTSSDDLGTLELTIESNGPWVTHSGNIPANALLGEDGQPLLSEDGNYILLEA